MPYYTILYGTSREGVNFENGLYFKNGLHRKWPQVRVPESTKIGVILNDYRIITIYNMQYF